MPKTKMKAPKKHRIVVMAGGTGGHVFPALAVADYLRDEDWEVTWLGTQKGLESRVVPERGIEIDYISVAGFRGKGFVAKIAAIFALLKACLQARAFLCQRKPDVVLGMGGFVAGPGGLMAKLLGIPLVIHEQNRVPGTTNRLLAGFAKQVLEAFPDSFNKKTKAVCTGNPLRKAFLDRPEITRAADGNLHILVVGGSQGAQILNETLPDAMAELDNITVKHQTGEAMREQVAANYENLGVNAEVSAFLSDMVAAFVWADLVICRAGAMTVSEVAAMGKPAIFVPLPNAIDDHQRANARYLTDSGAGVMLEQKDLTAASLAAKVREVKQDLKAMGQAAKACARLNATADVANFCKNNAKIKVNA
jgi:UDP-N-acetylglucosamine--N-acetylmuramyl-(pentapeptide) pyrophosphoryl-undecaprenol N-acetylglucosamine transferase